MIGDFFQHLQISHCRHYRNHTNKLPSHNFTATNRVILLCQHRKFANLFYIDILRSTFANSEGQAWLCIAALATIHRSSKFCIKYWNRSNQYMMIMTSILSSDDHSTFINPLKSIINYSDYTPVDLPRDIFCRYFGLFLLFIIHRFI